MRRRDLVACLGALVFLPGSRAAAESRKVAAFVLPVIPSAEMAGPHPVAPPAAAFLSGLTKLGWVDGQNLTLYRLSAEGRAARALALFRELSTRRVDVVVIGAATWLLEAARQAKVDKPIATIFAEDPVEAGHVRSFAKPGGNITGVTAAAGPEIAGKRIQLLKEIAPGVSHVAFLGTRKAWDQYRAVAHATEDEAVFVPLERAEQIESSFERVRLLGAEGLMVQAGPVAYVHAQRIVDFAAQNRLPAIYSFREPVEAGGLLSYGTSVEGLFEQLAGFADRILRGSHPSEMPIEQPTRYELVLNLRAARALGLAIPHSALVRADSVID